jgi:hypothetical protein
MPEGLATPLSGVRSEHRISRIITNHTLQRYSNNASLPNPTTLLQQQQDRCDTFTIKHYKQIPPQPRMCKEPAALFTHARAPLHQHEGGAPSCRIMALPSVLRPTPQGTTSCLKATNYASGHQFTSKGYNYAKRR